MIRARRTGMEKRTIRVSRNRQITIPQKFFESLGFGDELECVLCDDGVLLKPITRATGSEFSEFILADLIKQGYTGDELLRKFKEVSAQVRPAVGKIIDEVENYAKNGGGDISLDELFGTEA